MCLSFCLAYLFIPLNLTLKFKFLSICCPYAFPKEIAGKSWISISEIHLVDHVLNSCKDSA